MGGREEDNSISHWISNWLSLPVRKWWQTLNLAWAGSHWPPSRLGVSEKPGCLASWGIRLWPPTSAQGLLVIYFPNKWPDTFLTLSQCLQFGQVKGMWELRLIHWFEMTSFNKYIFSAPCSRPWLMAGGKIGEVTQRWVGWSGAILIYGGKERFLCFAETWRKRVSEPCKYLWEDHSVQKKQVNFTTITYWNSMKNIY